MHTHTHTHAHVRHTCVHSQSGHVPQREIPEMSTPCLAGNTLYISLYLSLSVALSLAVALSLPFSLSLRLSGNAQSTVYLIIARSPTVSLCLLLFACSSCRFYFSLLFSPFCFPLSSSLLNVKQWRKLCVCAYLQYVCLRVCLSMYVCTYIWISVCTACVCLCCVRMYT